MTSDDAAVPLLNALVARADRAGHVMLSDAEVDFALSNEGEKWLVPLDASKRLYKLTSAAHERLGLSGG
ncbi:MAG TPA: hypothetical protein VHM00_03780 [Caldimonas sp.]|jgi:hypothetical protein|nr:hypothetical protein [Caldimonas sp.]HEX2540185.1 hypothetical protein [Caldimonas sp.]